MKPSPLAIDVAATQLAGQCSGGVILAVLGYSSRDVLGLHPVCAARLERGTRELGDADAVVLSGWARRLEQRSEAELMWQAWPGSDVPVVSDPHARTTVDSAVRTAALANSVGAYEIRVVTSRWHMRRALFLFNGAVREAGIRVSAAPANDPPALRRTIREAGGWLVAPVQLWGKAAGASA